MGKGQELTIPRKTKQYKWLLNKGREMIKLLNKQLQVHRDPIVNVLDEENKQILGTAKPSPRVHYLLLCSSWGALTLLFYLYPTSQCKINKHLSTDLKKHILCAIIRARMLASLLWTPQPFWKQFLVKTHHVETSPNYSVLFLSLWWRKRTKPFVCGKSGCLLAIYHSHVNRVSLFVSFLPGHGAHRSSSSGEEKESRPDCQKRIQFWKMSQSSREAEYGEEKGG